MAEEARDITVEARDITPAEAFALGALHGILRQAGLTVRPMNEEQDFRLSDRGFDVYGLVPTGGTPVCIRITIAEA